MTWAVPAPHVSPTRLRRELTVGLMSMEKALLGQEHAQPLLIGAWLRYILKILEKTKEFSCLRRLFLRCPGATQNWQPSSFPLICLWLQWGQIQGGSSFPNHAVTWYAAWKCKSQCEKCACCGSLGTREDFRLMTMPAFAWPPLGKPARSRGCFLSTNS